MQGNWQFGVRPRSTVTLWSSPKFESLPLFKTPSSSNRIVYCKILARWQARRPLQILKCFPGMNNIHWISLFCKISNFLISLLLKAFYMDKSWWSYIFCILCLHFANSWIVWLCTFSYVMREVWGVRRHYNIHGAMLEWGGGKLCHITKISQREKYLFQKYRETRNLNI